MTDLKLPQFLTTKSGERIAYKMSAGAVDTDVPTLIWCGGLKSDMEGGKATHLHAWADARGQGFIRFDYFGHGQSSGDFIDGTISRWAKDVTLVRDQLTTGPVILIGSSMGGWAAMLSAMQLTPNVAGLVLINPAPDFTEKLTKARWSEAQLKALDENGIVYEPSGYDEPYAYSKTLIEDGRKYQILDYPIPITCPVRILQGYDDSVVPWQHSKLIVDMISSHDVTYTLVKGGDHSLSRPQDLALIETAIAGIG
ncbi:alpha/beta hydrolase [Litorimonas sp. RW-G-Af-16]|uniref:alpha/beta hydrolase n=1 Tax=Litorimonas sp. RW-G-Af-16 TaxID=3241168 RepID=UPI00390C7E85